VQRTDTDLGPFDAMRCYKQLTMVEQAFRTGKALFETRPRLDETNRGYVSCSFLARIADLRKPGSWPEILADLSSLTETEVAQDGKRFMRHLALRAV
jgi:hypothetical protein